MPVKLVDVWKEYVRSLEAVDLIERQLRNNLEMLVPVLRNALEQPEQRPVAVVFIKSIPESMKRELLPDLFELASFVHGLTESVREIILQIDRQWLRPRVMVIVRPILERNDYEEYAALLPLVEAIDSSMALSIARRALKSDDSDLQEVGEDYLECREFQ